MQRMTHHKPHENLNQSKFTKSQKELPYRSHCRSIQKHHYRASYCIQYDLSACIDVITHVPVADYVTYVVLLLWKITSIDVILHTNNHSK